MGYKFGEINPICPSCNNPIYINIDSFGHTPFHLHCDNCDINIGSTSINKCIELLSNYCKPKTYLEFYNNKLMLLFEEGKMVICNEK